MNYFNRYSKKNNYENDESEYESDNEREIYIAANKRKNIANNSFGTKKFKHD